MDQGKSVTGFLIYLNGDLLNWNFHRQSIMATSSTAADIIAVFDSLDDVKVLWFLENFCNNNVEPVKIFEDNISTLKICSGGGQKRARALMIKCYAILESVSEKMIEFKNISTKNQVADLLTKSLDKNTFLNLVNQVLEIPV